MQLMRVLGVHVGMAPRPFVQLCRVIRERELEEGWRRRVLLWLMQGLGLARGKNSLAIELFLSLQRESASFRFQAYEECLKGGVLVTAHMRYQFWRMDDILKKGINRLSKENRKEIARKVCKLSHSNPFMVSHLVLQRLISQAFDDNIMETLEVFIYSNPLTLEVIVLVLLVELGKRGQGRDRTNAECLPWFRVIYKTLSQFFKKYPTLSPTLVVGYSLTRLARSIIILEVEQELPGTELFLLRETVARMAGCTFSIETEKVQARGGGPRLFLDQAALYLDLRGAKSSSSRLRDYFWRETVAAYEGRDLEGGPVRYSLMFYMLVALAQKRSQLVSHSCIASHKVFGRCLDEFTSCYLALLQTIRLLEKGEGSLLPSSLLPLMVGRLKVPFELACLAARLRAKDFSDLSELEWKNLANMYE
jgi:hypothetical protein